MFRRFVTELIRLYLFLDLKLPYPFLPKMIRYLSQISNPFQSFLIPLFNLNLKKNNFYLFYL